MDINKIFGTREEFMSSENMGKEKHTNPEAIKLSLIEFRKSIPKNHYTTSQNIKNKVECRWRVLRVPLITEIPEKVTKPSSDQNNKEIIPETILYTTVVEISRKMPGKDREYIDNKTLQWKYEKIDEKYDQYVQETYYYYTDK